ncbi:MAG: hypothetical protein J5928_02445 [Firmicutes bacterium]|nr:hypothetical protein [Bacillota bacterium]
MDSSKFKVIEGNLIIDPVEAGGDFIYAEAIDTRLMGVVGLHILRDRGGAPFHQFFYIDTEEYGLDDYQSFLKMEREDVEKKKTELFGALGGEWKEVTEKEALYMVKQAARINAKYKLPLPEGSGEYRAILESDIALNLVERAVLWNKITLEIRSNYELINYFIMRMVAGDTEGISRLSSSRGDIRYINMSNPGTLLRNEIRKADEDNAKSSDDEPDGIADSDGIAEPILKADLREYTCVSLIDVDKVYQLVESEITVLEGKVIRYHHGEPMTISPWEASLILGLPEFLIYATIEDKSDASVSDSDLAKRFSKVMTSIFSTVTESEYDFGSLFMVFRKNNDHVRKKVYRLDQDTIGVVCHLDSDELVFASNDMVHVEALEKSVLAGAMLDKIKIKVIGRYQFPEPILVRFIDSDFERFSDFLDYLKNFQAD